MAILSYLSHHNTAQYKNDSLWAPENCCKDFSWIQVEIPG